MFNDINIERYDTNGTVLGTYRVPLRYGPKTKAYLWVKDNSRNEEMLPMMSVTMTGIDFDTTRLTNKHQEIRVDSGAGSTGTFASNGIPYNIGFTLNMWVLHMVDVDQIYEQILPYFMPHSFIKVKIPELNTTFDAKVILQGCSPIMTDDVGEDEARVIKWDTTFQVQTWFFKPAVTKPLIGLLGSSGTSGFAWTSGEGTSGYGTDGTSGKVVNRYYMNEDTFDLRDTPEMEIYSDPRISEVYTFRPTGGIDEEARIILDHETFGEAVNAT